eukprot:1755460-Alexandrium_andersonii.AAC.1
MFHDCGPPLSPCSSVDSGSARTNAAERTPRELRGPSSRPNSGPRGSRSECLEQAKHVSHWGLWSA